MNVIAYIYNNDKPTVTIEISEKRRVFRCHDGLWFEEENGKAKQYQVGLATKMLIEIAIYKYNNEIAKKKNVQTRAKK